MNGQLCWIPTFGSKGKLSLHLRLESFHPWKPYTAFPGLCIPDYPIASGSKGWATNQKLLQAGWTAISTQQAQRSFVGVASALRNRPMSSLIKLSDDDQLAA
jgi:hypothetical protein